MPLKKTILNDGTMSPESVAIIQKNIDDRKYTGNEPGTAEYGTFYNAYGSPATTSAERLGALGRAAPNLQQWNPQYLGNSAVAGANPDAQAQQGQRMAIQELQGLYNTGGFDAIDRAKMAEGRALVGQQEQGQRQAIQQNLEARGMAGSGTEIGGMLAAQQAGANRLSADQLGIDALGQQRRLDALLNMAGISSDVRGQSFGEDVTRRTAQDEINLYNNKLANIQTQMNNATSQQEWENLNRQSENIERWRNQRQAEKQKSEAQDAQMYGAALEGGTTLLGAAFGLPI